MFLTWATRYIRFTSRTGDWKSVAILNIACTLQNSVRIEFCCEYTIDPNGAVEDNKRPIKDYASAQMNG